MGAFRVRELLDSRFKASPIITMSGRPVLRPQTVAGGVTTSTRGFSPGHRPSISTMIQLGSAPYTSFAEHDVILAWVLLPLSPPRETVCGRDRWRRPRRPHHAPRSRHAKRQGRPCVTDRLSLCEWRRRESRPSSESVSLNASTCVSDDLSSSPLLPSAGSPATSRRLYLGPHPAGAMGAQPRLRRSLPPYGRGQGERGRLIRLPVRSCSLAIKPFCPF